MTGSLSSRPVAVAREYSASKASQALRPAFGVESSSMNLLERTTARLEAEGEINFLRKTSSLSDLKFSTGISSVSQTMASSFRSQKFPCRRCRGRLGCHAPTLKSRSRPISPWAAWLRRTLQSSVSARRKRYRRWPELCLSVFIHLSKLFFELFLFYFARIWEYSSLLLNLLT